MKRTLQLLLIMLTPYLAVSQCIPAHPNLVGWWDGDNYTSTKLGDVVLGNDANLIMGPTKSAGNVCDAMDMDGIDDYFTIPHNDSLGFGNGISDRPFSIEAWVFLNDANGNSIITKGDLLKREFSFRFSTSNPGKLSFAVYDDRRPGGTYNVIGKSSTMDFFADENSWIHVAVTYDGSGSSSGMKLYRNGVAISDTITISDSLGSNYIAMQDSMGMLCIGKFFHDGTSQLFDGKIDELSVYSKVLTTSEILAIYQANTYGKCGGTPFLDTSGCHGSTVPSGISNRSNTNLNVIYQNPVVNTLKLRSNDVDLNYYTVQILNINGQIVHINNNAAKRMNLSSLSNGTYIMTLINREGTERYPYKLLVANQ